MPKLSLLILDANVVISLHDLGIWSRVLEICDIHLSRTVVKESAFFGSNEAEGVSIDLSIDEKEGRITVFDLDASEVQRFQSKFDSVYAGKLDAGECESLAHLDSSSDDYRICSADAIVYKVLGNLNRGEQGISLEELLRAMGRGQKVEWRNSKKFREKYTSEGAVDAVLEKVFGQSDKPKPRPRPAKAAEPARRPANASRARALATSRLPRPARIKPGRRASQAEVMPKIGTRCWCMMRVRLISLRGRRRGGASSRQWVSENAAPRVNRKTPKAG